MKINVTTTSTSLRDLIVTAHGQGAIDALATKRVRDTEDTGTGVLISGVLMKNWPTNPVYFTNVLDAVTTENGFPILPNEAVSFEVRELSNVKLVSGTTQGVFVEIF